MGRSSAAAAALVAGLLVHAALADAPPLSRIPTSIRGEGSVEPRLPLRIAVAGPVPQSYRDLLGLPAEAVRADAIELLLRDELRLPPADPAKFLSATFLVDHDEPSLATLRGELVRRHGEAPTRDDLAEFVRGAIEDKRLGRGWDVASRVAATRSGDCTEHAVLLAALARSVGRPARVVVGAVLVTEDGGFATLGHAWTELHERDVWYVADAALGPGAKPLAYLPLGVLEDEGPGHMLGIARLLSNGIRSVEILGNE